MVKIQKKMIMMLFLLTAMVSVIAVIPRNEIKVGAFNATNDTLNEGKNLIYFERYINAREVILLNPEVESISYYDDFQGLSIGYVNIFGGIGKNFLIIPEREYEINLKKSKKLVLS